jgi:hypothetical protein
MLERRKETRWPAYFGGRIITDRRDWAVDCVVRNMSEGGARVVVRQDMLIPREFTLRIPWRRMEMRVFTRWRGQREFGVEAASGAASVPIDLELERRLRDLDAHTATLKRQLAEMGSRSL